MNKSYLTIVTAAVLVFLVVVLLFVYSIFAKVSLDQNLREIEITSGQSVKQISRYLTDAGIVKNDFWFRTYIWLLGKEKKIKAGKFDLPGKINAVGLLKILTASGRDDVVSIKILEGWGINDISAYLASNISIPTEEFKLLTGEPIVDATDSFNFASQFPLLRFKPANKSMEGFLFPDTYEIFEDSNASDIIKKMLVNFEDKVAQDLLDETQRQGKDFYDILIMASIIEAEVPHEDDRSIVSDIFWSRLESGVALQSDATLNYAIGGDNPSLTLTQLQIDSPYNSYKYRGLPPTPIGNPGLSAIKAALYPADTDYFYFLSTPEGETIFSTTLEEHNRAKAIYLR